jgi:hypothetical protein
VNYKPVGTHEEILVKGVKRAGQSPWRHPELGAKIGWLQRRRPMRTRDRWSLLCATVAAGLAVLPAPPAAGTVGGSVEWISREFGPGTDRSAGMAQGPDGFSLYVAGTSEGGFAVTAIDAPDGDPRWTFQGTDPNDLADFAHDIAVSPDGSQVFVTGDAEVNVDTREFVTVALDAATGGLMWATRESAGLQHVLIPQAVAVAPGGDLLYVTGSREGTQGASDFWDYFTVAYDTETGGKVWEAAYNGPGNGADVPVAVVAAGSRVFVTGTSVGANGGRDFGTVAYAAGSGAELWTAREATPGDDYAADLAVGPDGRVVYVAGTVGLFTGTQDMRAVTYRASTGARLRALTYDGGDADSAAAIAVSPNGTRVFLAGSSRGDFATVAFSALRGRQLWVSRFGQAARIEAAGAVAVAPSGDAVYVTGAADNGLTCGLEFTIQEYATVGYTATSGAMLWSARYDGNRRYGIDTPTDVDVSRDGSSVFVTGTSDDGCSSVPSDIATISYTA